MKCLLVGSCGCCLSLLNQHVRHLISLPLGSNMGSQPLLAELESPLVLGNPQQFHTSLLVWRKSRDFPDNVPNELVVLRDSLLDKWCIEKRLSIKESNKIKTKATYVLLRSRSRFSFILDDLLSLFQSQNNFILCLCHYFDQRCVG